MKVYVTTQGQTWDMIAADVYGNELYADYLMQNNLEHLEIFVFPAGIELSIPDLPEGTDEVEQPEWRW